MTVRTWGYEGSDFMVAVSSRTGDAHAEPVLICGPGPAIEVVG